MMMLNDDESSQPSKETLMGKILSTETTHFVAEAELHDMEMSCVPIYEPVRFGTSQDIESAVLRGRDGEDFTGRTEPRILRKEDGSTFFSAPESRDNPNWVVYLLLREAAIMDRDSMQITASKENRLVGLTVWDRVAINKRPGLYYVIGMGKEFTPENNLFLGPFGNLLDTLMHIRRTTHFVSRMHGGENLVQCSAISLNATRAEDAPRGRFNAALLTQEQIDAMPGAEFFEQMTAVRRLALVNEWSDALLDHIKTHFNDNAWPALMCMKRAAEKMHLSTLRGGDPALSLDAARTLGFNSVADFQRFQGEHPMLSVELGAQPALNGGSGRVIGLSSTEIVFASDQDGQPLFFERARLPLEARIGDRIDVGRFGVARLTALGQIDLATSDSALSDTREDSPVDDGEPTVQPDDQRPA